MCTVMCCDNYVLFNALSTNLENAAELSLSSKVYIGVCFLQFYAEVERF